jgi:hypothetical protein
MYGVLLGIVGIGLTGTPSLCFALPGMMRLTER